MSDNKWLRIGNVLVGKPKKDGSKSNYIKIRLPRDKEGNLTQGETVTLKDGQIIQLQDPRKSKFMTPERAAKIPAYVKAELVVPPANSEE